MKTSSSAFVTGLLAFAAQSQVTRATYARFASLVAYASPEAAESGDSPVYEACIRFAPEINNLTSGTEGATRFDLGKVKHVSIHDACITYRYEAIDESGSLTARYIMVSSTRDQTRSLHFFAIKKMRAILLGLSLRWNRKAINSRLTPQMPPTHHTFFTAHFRPFSSWLFRF